MLGALGGSRMGFQMAFVGSKDDRMQDVYDNPLIARYASRGMAELWSPKVKFSTWRGLWVALARAERQLGLAITAEQVSALEAQVDTIDFTAADAYERRFRHDVMAHIHALGDAAPLARPIIHLGATSCFVTDNADLIITRRALGMVRDKLVRAIDALASFAARWKDLPCLGYTHFQPAQLVTVGKRATLWCRPGVGGVNQESIGVWPRLGLIVRGVKYRTVKGRCGLW